MALHARRPPLGWKAILLALVLLMAGAAYGAYTVYQANPTSGRPAGEVLLLCDTETAGVARQLSAMYEAAFPGCRVDLREMPFPKAQALLVFAEADLGLYPESQDLADLHYQRLFFQHGIAVSPLFGPCESLTISQAKELPSGTLSDPFDTACFLTTWDQMEPGMRLVPIEGVLPNPENLKDGTYPLTKPVGMYWGAPPKRGILDLFRSQPDNAGNIEDFRDLASSPLSDNIYYPGMTSHITLRAAGDIMFGRGVDARIQKFGWDYPLAEVAQYLSRADLCIANLESPIGVKGQPLPGKMIWFRARPESAQALVQAGIDAVNLANNHILDYDTENFLETLEILDDLGIGHFGGGRDIHESREPLILESRGIRVAFLGYCEFAHPDLFWSVQYPRTFEAKEGVPGVNPINKDYISEDIALAREQADVVVTMFHWGAEDVHYPEPFWIDQVEVARFAVDAGADLVLGTHPHAVQGIELYNGRYIAYSLGNFVMDQKREFQKESLILTFTVTERGISCLSVDPCYITECQPSILQGEARQDLLDRVRHYSRGLR